MVKYGLVGAGYFGADLARALNQQEDAKVTVVYDPDNGAKIAEELGCDEAAGLDELVELMVDTVCSRRETIRIAGDDYPAEVVKSRFLKLNSSHIEYVLDRMRENTTYVRNIKKYLLAALYNAPATIDNYYASLVNHDLYGGGERR